VGFLAMTVAESFQTMLWADSKDIIGKGEDGGG